MPLFRDFGDRALLITAAVLILLPIAIDAAVVLTHARFDPVAPLLETMDAEDARYGNSVFDAFLALAEGGWQVFFHANERGWLFRFVNLVDSNRPLKVLGLFLLGLWVSRRKLFVDAARHSSLLKRICIGGFLIGLPSSVLMWWAGGHAGSQPEPLSLLHTAGYAFSVVPLALAYASGFAWLWLNGARQKRLLVLAPVGRMALTNYLMQSIIAIALFYGIGLGWGTHVSAVVFDGVALVVFIVQVLWSHWWLARFQYGPFEWVWRSLTYGRPMPMRT